jgi:CHAT domain-containing protein
MSAGASALWLVDAGASAEHSWVWSTVANAVYSSAWTWAGSAALPVAEGCAADLLVGAWESTDGAAGRFPGSWEGGSSAGVRVNGDIELEIGAGSGVGNYAVRVIRAAAGGEPAGALELDVEELLSRRDVLEATVLASAVPRRGVPLNEQPVREVGVQLFRALFSGRVYGTYRASLGAAQQYGRRLRLVLRLTAPELAALPWEMLFDPETETYLCRQEPLVRHVDAPYTAEPLQVLPPLRVLGLIASPRGLPALDVEAEKDHLAEALAGSAAEGLVEVVWVPEATWDGVHARLLAGHWHVLHFVGHGDYDARADEGVLALVGRDGRADLVEASRLADLLDEAQPTPRLVVLNSCSSGQAGAHDLFSGTAAALVRKGISAVAAMQFAISDTAAIAFARGFYTAIAYGRSVDEAARSGRISILGAPRSLEWVTPVLYVRGQATRLFTLTPSRADGRDTLAGDQAGADAGAHPPATGQATEPDRRKQAELSALYVAARAELRLEHFGTAMGLFDDLLILDPGYPGAAGLRDMARRGQQLADAYAQATAAEDASDWIAAARGYDAILQIDSAYRDAAARKEACQARQAGG